MPAQPNDALYTERMGIPGKILVSDLAAFIGRGDYHNGVYDVDQDYTYNAWELIDGSGWYAERIQIIDSTKTTATGALPVPADLKTITYS